MSSIVKVKDFMKMANQPTPKQAKIPSSDRVLLRLGLILEELTELAQASGKQALLDYRGLLLSTINDIDKKNIISKGIDEKGDIVECLDAFVDIRYVVDGSVIEYGLDEVHGAAFEEVHNSNMSKACKNEDEALETVGHYAINKGEQSYYKYDTEKDVYLVLRRKDDKLLKSINYKPANLNQFIK